MDPEKKKEFRASLLSSAEGRLLLIGVGMAFLYTLWLGANLLFAPERSQVFVGMTAIQILFGRAAGMAFGYSLGLDSGTIISVCVIVETILVLLFYPLFVFSWRRLLVLKWLKNLFNRTRRVAEARKGRIQKYGIAGLFVFVWFPFWMTGPMIGCVIGFLLGLRTWVNITVVLAGTYFAIFGWAFFLRQFNKQVASYNSYAAMVLVILLIAIVVLGYFLSKNLNGDKDRPSQ